MDDDDDDDGYAGNTLDALPDGCDDDVVSTMSTMSAFRIWRHSTAACRHNVHNTKNKHAR